MFFYNMIRWCIEGGKVNDYTKDMLHHSGHVTMWNYLSDYKCFSKEAFFDSIFRKLGFSLNVENGCFACESSKLRYNACHVFKAKRIKCLYCPIDWDESGNIWDEKFCCCPDTLYRKWDSMALSVTYNFLDYDNVGDCKLLQLYAKGIADLKWRGL